MSSKYHSNRLTKYDNFNKLKKQYIGEKMELKEIQDQYYKTCAEIGQGA